MNTGVDVGANAGEYREGPLVAHLRDENTRLRLELREAQESERKVWRALVMAKGAAECLAGAAKTLSDAVNGNADANMLSRFDELVRCALDDVRTAEEQVDIALGGPT